jgi:hypothetical protein
VQGGQVQHRVQRPLLRGEDAGEFHYTVGDDLCYVPTFLICSTLQASMLFLKMCSEMFEVFQGTLEDLAKTSVIAPIRCPFFKSKKQMRVDFIWSR